MICWFNWAKLKLSPKRTLYHSCSVITVFAVGDFAELTKHPFAVERIVQEIEHPDNFHVVANIHEYPFALRHPLLRSPPLIQIHLVVNAIHTLVISRRAHLVHPVIALLETPTQLRCY